MSGKPEHPLLPRIKELRAQGLSMAAIGREMGLTKNQVIGIWARAGLQDSGRSPIVARTWLPHEDATLRTLAALGLSDWAIAARLGCSATAVAARRRALLGGAAAVRPREAAPRMRSAVGVSPPDTAESAAGLDSSGASREALAAMVPAAGAAGGVACPAPPRQPMPRPARVTLPRGPVAAARSCQWPEGDVRGAYRFECTAPLRPGSPYCAAHHARAHVRAPAAEAAE